MSPSSAELPELRPMQEADRGAVMAMMAVFYASDAVATNGSQAIFQRDVDECLSNSPFLEGYCFESDGRVIGYAMLAKSFSTEYGRPCVWVEDIYLQPEFRGMGLAGRFFRYAEERNPDALFRLEAEDENTHALHVYRKQGYCRMPYAEFYKELKE